MIAPERRPPSKAFLTPVEPLNPLALVHSLFLSPSLFHHRGWFSRILPRRLLPSKLGFTVYKPPIFLFHSLATSRLFESPPKLLPLFAFNAPLFFPASPRCAALPRHHEHTRKNTDALCVTVLLIFPSYSARKVNEFSRCEIVFVSVYLSATEE